MPRRTTRLRLIQMPATRSLRRTRMSVSGPRTITTMSGFTSLTGRSTAPNTVISAPL